jgi:hypothetical protein
MASTTKTAKPAKIARHPVTGINHCTGKVDDNMPKEPVINIHELARN